MLQLKHVTLILLISLLVFSQAGYYLFYLIEEIKIEHEFREKLMSELKDDQLYRINAEDPDIQWEEDDEFSFHDEMYDVVRTRIIDGKKFFFCFNDKKENELKHQFNSINSNQRTDNNKLPLLKIFSDLQIGQSGSMLNRNIKYLDLIFTEPGEKPASGIHRLFMPPPKFLLRFFI